MNKIVKALIEGKLISRICTYTKNIWVRQWSRLDEAIGVACRKLAGIMLKVEPNKIVFMTYQNQYTCNPKYITEKLVQNDQNLDLVWIVDNNTMNDPKQFGIPEQVRLVQRNSYQSFYELMSAKIWIDNALNCPWRRLSKKKDQIYINTWHGSLGIKRLDTYNPDKGYWYHIAHRTNKMIDYMLSNSDFETNVFHTSYWPDVKVLKTGHARNDLFFDKKEMSALRSKVLDFYGLDNDVKLLLYAPTFREDKNTLCFDMNYEKVVKAVAKKFPGKWKLLVRLHFHNKEKAAKTQWDDCIINATTYPDIQELMGAADIGITDYSSWIYDFMLTGRPCFIYASDIDIYNNQRGFYYPLETTPFPIAKTTKELCKNIESFEIDTYQQKVKTFLDEKGCMEDGHACDRIQNIILDIINNKELNEDEYK
jgi:CDP-glycerol glycerophosphotransferase